jgi:hypothetical protein
VSVAKTVSWASILLARTARPAVQRAPVFLRQRNFLDRAGITLVSSNPRRNAEQSYGSILGITGFGLCGRGPRLLRDTAD